ncbi:class I lanthipeptide [uncultured Aquimarina sp.]|uniref:class I lanthipeptide n=1 Tax=uncultured Aquimarina sp. TaxID=575652 RepID=UPI002610A934|nr:class I lanthipeptide [uncultured Aquimarina sp.]
MKTKDENFVQKIKLNKIKIATLSRDAKKHVLGGSMDFPSFFCEEKEKEIC